ncbi:carbohydrate kinase family protein [Celerinatantimonas sp. YJH-8]|uniref:carbohydrate kinase family protein n=1 Tax=Celerinatantimonas sp. YJH-8 TaxID=3228714 RepID=UPI0038C3F95F
MTEQSAPTLYIIGNVNIDLIMGPLDQWPQRGTEALLPTSHWRVGGSAGNSALAAQALGFPYQIIANQSQDIFGDWLAGHFQQAQHWPRTDTPASITVGITHSDGERTFFTGQGNVEQLSLAEVLEQLPEHPVAGSIALLSGAFLTLSLLDDYPQLIHELHQRNYQVALDCGWPPQQWDRMRKCVIQWLNGVDHLLLNEIEIQQLSQHDVLSDAAQALASYMPSTGQIVIKRGPRGASHYANSQWCHCPAREVTIIDSVGAGDIFNTGYLTARMQHQRVETALCWGTTLASHAISSHPRHLMSQAQLIAAIQSEGTSHG